LGYPRTFCQGRRSTTRARSRRRCAALPALVALAAAPAAFANPQGGSIAAGSARIVASAPGRVDVNQSSDRVIINWQGFSIGAGETTRFNQPSSSSTALNRVTGGDPSLILGQLSANGRILLINPNGVLFGAGSRVDLAGLVATTANLSDQDFQAGRLNFALPSSRSTASVVNRGTITVAQGGLVALVAPGVSNEGVIRARLGRVTLVAADRFTVDFHGDRLIQFALDDKVTHAVSAPDGVPLAAAVANSGRIIANGGVVEMTANVARGVLDRVINVSGVVEARAARRVGGAILLDGGEAGTVQVSGTIDASGRRAGRSGGSVRILGEHVGLFAGARVDASGDAGGGTVLVGGSRRGQGPERNAQATYVDAKASIAADATTKGDGGTVVVWSDRYTHFDGRISARGGAQGGNGGQVETSAHGVLTATGKVDASAGAGKPGQWLLDPSDVQITTGTTNGSFSGGSPNVFTPAGTGTATADAGTISASLSTGTNVTINTASADTQSGDVTFANDGSVTNSGGATTTFTITAAGAISVSSGTPTIGIAGLATALNVDMTLGSAGTVPAMSLGTGSLTIVSSGNHVYQNGPITQSGGGGAVSINLNGDGTGPHGVTWTDPGNNITGTLSILNGAGSDVTIKNSGPLNLGTSTFVNAGSPVSITAGGSITQSGTLTNSGGATFTLASTAANSDILLDTQANDLGAAVSLGGALTNIRDVKLRNLNAAANTPDVSGATMLRNLTLQFDNAPVTLGALTASGTATITAGGSISQTGALTVGGTTNLAVTAANSDILLNTQANNLTGAVIVAGTPSNVRDFALRNTNAGATAPTLSALTSLRNLTLQLDNATAALGAFSATGAASIVAGGAITQSAPATVVGTSSFSAGTNAITLTQANSFTGAVSLSNSGANDVQLTNVTATALGTSSVGRNLTVTSGGAITETGALTVGGTTTLAATAANTDVLLSTQANNLGGAVSFAGAPANFRDVALRSVNAAATVSSLSGLANLRNLTLQFDAGAMTLGAFGASGNLVATAGGALTLTGLATVGGSATLTAPTIAITSGLTAGATTMSGAITASGLQVGGLTVSGASASMTGTVAGATGSSAAALTSGPIDTSHLMNGCELQIGCAAATSTGTPNLVTPAVVATATTSVKQVLGVLSQAPPPQDPNGSGDQHGYEVSIPTQNVDWSDPMGDLRVKLAPDFEPLKSFFYGGQASR
jgi:filamentous hemagglutinin family protein